MEREMKTIPYLFRSMVLDDDAAMRHLKNMYGHKMTDIQDCKFLALLAATIQSKEGVVGRMYSSIGVGSDDLRSRTESVLSYLKVGMNELDNDHYTQLSRLIQCICRMLRVIFEPLMLSKMLISSAERVALITDFEGDRLMVATNAYVTLLRFYSEWLELNKVHGEHTLLTGIKEEIESATNKDVIFLFQ
jgi:hypothetical protein